LNPNRTSNTSLSEDAGGSEETSGLIFDIQRFSIHDGPGIRTTVFLKGCPLSCQWCHNPESRLGHPQLAFYKTKCIGCGRCFGECVNGAIIEGDGRVDRTKCLVCGACANVCPAEALQMIGRVATVSEVVAVVMRDQPFYKTSGGGATISGGEPLYQYEFSLALLAAFKENGLHTALETCGLGPWERVAAFAELTDLFLYDMKSVNPEKHKKYCGVDNAVILANARALATSGADIIFRTPVVPGLNDTADDLRLLGEFIKSLPGGQKLELMPYHRIGSGKYEALGMDYPIPDVPAPENLDEQEAFLSEMGIQLVRRK
jgi:pyruvate formate lyase activating enzyme